MYELRPIKTYSDSTTHSLNDQTKFRLDEINKIKDYFKFKIREREAVIKKLIKYTAALDYTDKTLIVLFATSGGISIIFILILILIILPLSWNFVFLFLMRN